MARKLPPGVKPIFVYQDPVGMRPRIAVLIGTLCAEWARLEQAVGAVFCILMDGSLDDMYEAEVLEYIESVRVKTKVVLALSKHRIEDPTILKEIEKALARVESLGTQRNKYIHGRWAIAHEYTDEIVLLRRVGPTMISGALLISPADIESVVRDIRTHALSLYHYFDQTVRPILKPKPLGDWKAL